jgi:hypothetical protein
MPDVYFYLNADPDCYVEINAVPVAGWANLPAGAHTTVAAVADTTIGPGPYCGWLWYHAGGADERLWVPGPDPKSFEFCMPEFLPGGDHTEVILWACSAEPNGADIDDVCDAKVYLPFYPLMYCGGLKTLPTCLPSSDCLTGPIVSIVCD